MTEYEKLRAEYDVIDKKLHAALFQEYGKWRSKWHRNKMHPPEITMLYEARALAAEKVRLAIIKEGK